MSATNQRTRWRWGRKPLATALAIAALASSLAACSRPEDVEFPDARVFGLNSVVADSSGNQLGVFAAPGEKPGTEVNYNPVAQDKIVPSSPVKLTSQYIGWAIIDAEDAHFYEHNGYEGLAALKAAAQGGGGSTLTMQLMTITSLERQESLPDKFAYKDKQQALAKKYEAKLIDGGLSKRKAKNRILTEYSNQAPFCRQARGVDAASRSLFGHGITNKRFSLSKAAILAAMLKDPCHYASSKTDLQIRRTYVLDQMLRYGHITPEQHAAAMKEGIKLTSNWPNPPSVASSTEPYITQLAPMWLGGQFKSDAKKLLHEGDLTFGSTISGRMQKALNKSVPDNLPSSKLTAGVVIIDANSGEIKALYGGNPKRFNKDQRNMAVTEPRRGGSTSKVFTLAKAFEDGRTPEDKLNCPGQIYDYEARAGEYSLREAITISHNTCFLQLITDLGPSNVVNFTKKLLGDNQVLIPGSEGPKYDATPTFTLGTSEMTAYQRGAAIIPIANREGQAVKTHLYSKITKGDKTVWKYVAKATPVLDPAVAKTAFDTLTGVVGPGGTAEGLGIRGRRIMAKTGTDTKARTNAAVTYVAADQDSGLVCSVAITDPGGRKFSGATARDAGKICQQFYQDVL